MHKLLGFVTIILLGLQVSFAYAGEYIAERHNPLDVNSIRSILIANKWEQLDLSDESYFQHVPWNANYLEAAYEKKLPSGEKANFLVFVIRTTSLQKDTKVAFNYVSALLKKIDAKVVGSPKELNDGWFGLNNENSRCVGDDNLHLSQKFLAFRAVGKGDGIFFRKSNGQVDMESRFYIRHRCSNLYMVAFNYPRKSKHIQQIKNEVNQIRDHLIFDIRKLDDPRAQKTSHSIVAQRPQQAVTPSSQRNQSQSTASSSKLLLDGDVFVVTLIDKHQLMREFNKIDQASPEEIQAMLENY